MLPLRLQVAWEKVDAYLGQHYLTEDEDDPPYEGSWYERSVLRRRRREVVLQVRHARREGMFAWLSYLLLGYADKALLLGARCLSPQAVDPRVVSDEHEHALPGAERTCGSGHGGVP